MQLGSANINKASIQCLMANLPLGCEESHIRDSPLDTSPTMNHPYVPRTHNIDLTMNTRMHHGTSVSMLIPQSCSPWLLLTCLRNQQTLGSAFCNTMSDPHRKARIWVSGDNPADY